MKRYLPLTLLMLAALACNAGAIFFPGSENPAIRENIDPQSLTATLAALDTVIAQTTADASSAQAATETPAPDTGSFCDVYTEFVNDVTTRIDEYENVVGNGGDGDPLALALDQAIEGFMDRLVPIAPEEIRAEVEVLADMSLIGLFSSPDGKPEAEPFLVVVDNYASENCNISLNE